MCKSIKSLALSLLLIGGATGIWLPAAQAYHLGAYALNSRNGCFDSLHIQHPEPGRIFVFFGTGPCASGIHFLFYLFNYGFDDNVIDTHEFNLLQNLLLGAISDSQHGNYSRHPENNTERRQ